MTDDNLMDFLNGRVLPTRQAHHIAYPVNLTDPALAVWLDCPEDGQSVFILPTIANGLMHLEMHFFSNGERNPPTIAIPVETNGCIELTLRKPDESASV